MTNGDWLFSVEVPTDIAGTNYQPEDVVRYDTGGIYDLFFCGNLPPLSISSGSNVDAAFLLGHRDDGNLALSFEVPTTIAGTTYQPADLIELTFVGPGCQDWAVAGLLFDASAAVPPVPPESNVTGADEYGTGLLVLTFDVPTELTGTTYVPGELVQWDASIPAFSSLHKDPGWSIGSRANAVSLLAAAGTIVPPTLMLSKAGGVQITLDWSGSPSCSVGVEDYGIYEGSIGAFYSHDRITCTDTGGDLQETITPSAGDRYYLVVPNNANVEGSYGKDLFAGLSSERPVGVSTCASPQEIGCP
jgi:hypothetical protein